MLWLSNLVNFSRHMQAEPDIYMLEYANPKVRSR